MDSSIDVPTRDAAPPGVSSPPVHSSRTATRRETPTHRALRWGLLALPLAVLAERAWARRWINDDGFINLRVVSQLLAGNGPVFNAGERVEASTSPLWVFVLAAGDIVAPLRLEWVTVVTGIGLSLLGLWLAILGARLLVATRDPSELFVPAGAAVWVALTPVWMFSSSGLETGLTFGWIGLCLWILAQWARTESRLPAWSAAVIGLGPLIRPDLGTFALTFLVAVLLAGRRRDGWGDRARILAWALAIPVAYQLFRMGYYGSLVPNPASAKEASWSRWSEGWRYLRTSTGPYALWLPLVLLAAGAYLPLVRSARERRETRVLLVIAAFVTGGLLHAGYIVRVGGDFMHARLLLPALFGFVAPVAVVPLRRAYAFSFLVLPWVVAGVLFLRPSAEDVRPFGTTARHPVTVEDYEYQEGGTERAWFSGEGVYYVEARLPARTVEDREAEITEYGVGVVSYALGPDVYVLDLLGLGDAFTSHLRLDQRGTVGHEKPLPPPWIVARLTPPGTNLSAEDFPWPAGLFAVPLDDPDRAPFDERVASARAALRCSDLREFQETYTAPLTAGRFWSNLVGAFDYTRKRIPPEPEDTYRELCSSRP